jgi:hydrogenase nickel incorporation protein HypA/HybF
LLIEELADGAGESVRLHELSIAESVVQIASRHANGRRVTKVCLKVGHLRQVVPSALAFSFELVAQDTPVDGATLELEEVPATGLCRECGAESRLESFPLQCGACGGFDLEIIEGEELYVESLELEEARDASYGR